MSDPELVRLLAAEIARHVETLEAALASKDAAGRDAARRTLHALKGSAGLAGERDLSATFARIERRVRDGSGGETALAQAIAIARDAARRLAAGERAVASAWPEPPPDLTARPIAADARATYQHQLAEGLARIDVALAALPGPDDIDAVATAFRAIHTMKGAASAVGDDVGTWFCHGLEEALHRGHIGPDEARGALAQIARWRGVLGALVEGPEAALGALRRRTRPTTASPRAGDDVGREALGDAPVRVDRASIDRVFDGLAAVDVVRERMVARAMRAHGGAQIARRLRAELMEALQLIGPPRPWGAPAAALARVERAAARVGAIGDVLDATHGAILEDDQRLRETAATARDALSTMRRTSLGRLFARLSSAAEAEARGLGRVVAVRTEGAEVGVDRRLADLLVEPCLHLVRNAVAHGIESSEARAALGKPPTATISLRARRATDRVRISVEDDGAGVDVASVRERAVATGTISAEIAYAADDDTLLALLLLPGFSTRDRDREGVDLLAGRGVGLDIVVDAVERLGGTVHLASRRGQGFSARIDLPVETGITHVLWVEAGGLEHALFAAHALRVQRNDGPDRDRIPHLATCLDPPARDAPRSDRGGAAAAPFFVELDLGEGAADAPRIAVDRVGRTEEVLVRPLTRSVARLGPFAGAVVRGDGSLRLALDAHALAPRARALGRVDGPPSSTAGRESAAPRSRP